jgi:hypothetical protein
MARVISKAPRGEIKVECRHCNYEVGLAPSDIVSGTDPDDNTRYRYAHCPQCKKSISLPVTDDRLDDT